MDAFGEDRVVFGSDWPNSWGTATPAQIVSIARAYFATRSPRRGGEVFLEEFAEFLQVEEAGEKSALL